MTRPRATQCLHSGWRRLDDVTMSSPRPWSYDRAVTHGCFRDTRPDDGPIVDRQTALMIGVGVAVMVLGTLAWRAPFPVRLAVAIGMVAALFALVGGFLATYEAAMVRAHLSVVDRPELGDGRRWAVFGAAMIGYPLALLALLFAGIAAAQALTG